MCKTVTELQLRRWRSDLRLQGCCFNPVCTHNAKCEILVKNHLEGTVLLLCQGKLGVSLLDTSKDASANAWIFSVLLSGRTINLTVYLSIDSIVCDMFIPYQQCRRACTSCQSHQFHTQRKEFKHLLQSCGIFQNYTRTAWNMTI